MGNYKVCYDSGVILDAYVLLSIKSTVNRTSINQWPNINNNAKLIINYYVILSTERYFQWPESTKEYSRLLLTSKTFVSIVVWYHTKRKRYALTVKSILLQVSKRFPGQDKLQVNRDWSGFFKISQNTKELTY